MTLFSREATTTLSSRAKRGICILLFATASYSISAQSTLPPGWRRPSPVEVSAAWRRKSPTRFLIVKADFDGDGHTDVAEILTNESEKSGEWMTLWKGPAVELCNVGISMVRPGKYDTLSGLVWFVRANMTLCAAMTLPLVTRKLPNQSTSSTTLSAYFLKAKPVPFSIGIGKRRSLIPFRLVINDAVLFEADHWPPIAHHCS